MTNARLAPRLRDRIGTLPAAPGWRRVLLLRRVAAAVLLALALVLALAPSSDAAGVPLVVVTADLAPGRTLVPGDVAVREWPAALVPAGALRDPAAAHGRVLAGAARAGEPVTDVRLVGPGAPGLSGAGPDGAAVPIRLADAGVAALLVPGSRVDVVTAGERADRPAVLASDATVLAVLEPDVAARGRLALVAMPREIAARVAAASLNDLVAVTLRQR